jgi:hypothetical protein
MLALDPCQLVSGSLCTVAEILASKARHMKCARSAAGVRWVARGTSVLIVTLLLGSTTSSRVVATVEPSTDRLRDLGKRLAAAVLNRDVETILAHDRPDLRAEDRLALQDSQSPLYCFLFESSCSPTRPSVYEILKRGRRLDIDARVLQDKSGALYGSLLLFDAAKIRKSDLKSPSFLCQHVTELVSWMFRLDSGRWVSAHAPFDAETDVLCSPS